MGTRSTVIIVLNKQVLIDALLKVNPLPQELVDTECIHETEEAKYWLWGDIKWYETYPEIKTVMDYLSELDEDNFGFMENNEDYGFTLLGTPWEYGIKDCNYIDTPWGHEH